jgi:hypothetical protein
MLQREAFGELSVVKGGVAQRGGALSLSVPIGVSFVLFVIVRVKKREP